MPVAAAGEVAGTAESMGLVSVLTSMLRVWVFRAGTVESTSLVSILAAHEAAASDAMDCGLVLKGVLDTGRRRNCRLDIGVKNECCSTAVAGPMSVKTICAHQDEAA